MILSTIGKRYVNPVSDIGLSLDKEGYLRNGCIHNQESRPLLYITYNMLNFVFRIPLVYLPPSLSQSALRDEAVQNFASLKFSQSNHEPDLYSTASKEYIVCRLS